MQIKLFTTEVVDRYVRENFAKLTRYFQDDGWRKGNWSFFSADLSAASYPATLTIQHRLNFQPKDVLNLSVSPDTAVVTWNTDSFTRTTLSVTINAALTARVYLGRYEET